MGGESFDESRKAQVDFLGRSIKGDRPHKPNLGCLPGGHDPSVTLISICHAPSRADLIKKNKKKRAEVDSSVLPRVYSSALGKIVSDERTNERRFLTRCVEK